MTNLTIALDAMGGDNAPLSVLEGADLILATYPNVSFLIYGNEDILLPMLNKLSRLKKSSKIIHTDKVIAADEKPSSALRKGKDSSMSLAIEAVKEKRAAAVVSAGNTGALMVTAKLALRTLPDIHRPAIAGLMPTIKNKVVMLDLGANAECTAENLFQFAIMGDAFAKVILDIETPSIGLLNIGSEDVKGNDIVRLASTMLRECQYPLNFIGYIEGNDIAEGTCDVVVCDGFSGNIALKTIEGTAKFCKEVMRSAYNSSIIAKIGYLLSSCAIKKATQKLDHRNYNGAMFLGLNGIVVKSHGSADALGFANAIKIAVELAAHDINERIIKELESSQKLAAE